MKRCIVAHILRSNLRVPFQKVFDKQRNNFIKMHLDLKEEHYKVKKELELTLLQFNTSIKFKNTFQVQRKKIRRTRSLD